MNTKTGKLTATALMIALTLILGFTPLGFLRIPLTTIDITFMCLPIIIGTIIIGWKAGLLLGLVFALTSLFMALTAPTPLLAPLLQFPLALYPSIFVPRLLIPLATWGVYRLTRRMPRAIGLGFTAAAGSLTNTVFFLSMVFLLGGAPIAERFGMSVNTVGVTLATVVLTNGLPEAATAVLLCVPIILILEKISKKEIVMIITMDVGNTNIKTGIYDGREMVEYVRFSTDMRKTSDEYGLMLTQFLALKGIARQQIEAAVASSVVPSINFTLEHMCRTYLGYEPLFVGPGVKTGLNIRYDNPREVGSDRIASAVAAFELYGGPAIVIDFGTATTFNAVSAEGEFLGGAIMPGIKLSTEALVANAAKLPRIELIRPETVINRTTVGGMQAGIIYGYVGAVDNIVSCMRSELGDLSAQVIATGGLSRLISPESKTIGRVNGSLTLEGLRVIYERNRRNP